MFISADALELKYKAMEKLGFSKEDMLKEVEQDLWKIRKEIKRMLIVIGINIITVGLIILLAIDFIK